MKDLKTGAEKQLTDWLEQVSSPYFVRNDQEIAFTKDNNLYTIHVESRLIRQISNFVDGDERPEAGKSKQEQWLEQQQKELFVVLNEREAKNKARGKRQKAEETKEPLKIYTGKKRVSRLALSPSENYLVYSLYQSANGAKATSVTHHVTQSGYAEEHNARVKVGSPQGSSELGIFDTRNNQTVKINTTQIPGLKDQPDYLSDYPDRMPKDSSEIKDRPNKENS